MYNSWEVKYGAHRIRVESTLTSEKLFVDGVLQDELTGLHLSARLFGKVKNEDGQTEDIKVSVGFYCFNAKCRIFVGERLLYSTDVQWEG